MFKIDKNIRPLDLVYETSQHCMTISILSTGQRTSTKTLRGTEALHPSGPSEIPFTTKPERSGQTSAQVPADPEKSIG